MDNFVEEIQEDLKKDQLLKFWKDYGNYVIGALIALILGGAGYAYWDYAETQKRRELTQVYERALAETDPHLQAQAFSKLSASSNKGYAIIGAFEEAERAKNPAQAYRKISKEGRFDKVFRELAMLKAVSKEMKEGANPTVLLEDVIAITKTASPWREVAYEIEANLNLSAGKVDQALQIFETLAAMETAPQGVRQRAHIILDFIRNR